MRIRLVVICIVISTAVLPSASHGSAQDFCFQTAVNYAAGDGPSSVFAADLDGDNDADLAVANAVSANVSVLKNNGDGTLASWVNLATGDGPRSVIGADLDGDGRSTLLLGETGVLSPAQTEGLGADFRRSQQDGSPFLGTLL